MIRIAREGDKMRRSVAAALFLVALLAGAAGCDRPEVSYKNDEFPFRLLLENRLALGGIVANGRVRIEPEDPVAFDREIPNPYAEADRWARYLETSFLVQAPELDRWAWPAVADQVDPVLMTSLFRDYRRGGALRREQLRQLGAELPGTRFLLLARIDENNLSLESGGALAPFPSSSSGLGKAADPDVPRPLDRGGYSQRRTIRLSMELYDLETGRSIWTAAVRRDRDELLDGDAAGQPPSVRVRKDPATESGVLIDGRGGLGGGPTLEDLLPEACDALVAELLILARF